MGELGRRSEATAYFVQADFSAFDLTGFAAKLAADVADRPGDHRRARARPVPGTRSLDALIDSVSLAQARARLAGVAVGTEDVLTFQLSGGTTGVPKIIPRFHAEYMGSARDWARRQLMDENVVQLYALPLIHNAGTDREPVPRPGHGRHDRAHAAHGPQGVLRVGRAASG